MSTRGRSQNPRLMPSQNFNEDESGSTQLRPASKDAKSAQNERRPALVSLRGELLAVPIPLERDEVIIGRAIEADVRLNDSRASRLHARISSDLDPRTKYHHLSHYGSRFHQRHTRQWRVDHRGAAQLTATRS